MDENSTPSSVLGLSQGLGFTMYTSVFQEVVMPQSSWQWKVLSGFGERSCDTMSLRPGHRLHRSTHFVCSRQTLPETHSPTPRFHLCFHFLSMHSCSAFCTGQTSLWFCFLWEFYLIASMRERAEMGRQESQLTGEVHVSLRPFASAPESSLQCSCPFLATCCPCGPNSTTHTLVHCCP